MNCPGCGVADEPALLESSRDPLDGKQYRVGSCPNCELIYSEPRVLPGVSWYARAHSGESATQAGDWRHDRFFESVRPEGTLIDLGCGAGQFLAEAKRRGFTIFGVDFNPDYVAQARSLGVPCELVSDFDKFLTSPGGPYASAALFDVLEHVPEPLKFLESIAKLLTAKGTLAISVPNGARPMPCASLRESFDYPPYHFTRWTARSLTACLQKTGFTIESVKFSPLHFGYFAGLVYYRLLKTVFPLMKRLLFGAPAASSEKTWTELLPPTGSLLSQPTVRQKVVNVGLFLFTLVSFPLELPAWAWFRVAQPQKGRTLFVLARKA